MPRQAALFAVILPVLVAVGLLSGAGCGSATVANAPATPEPPGSQLPRETSFDAYWYPHGAELSRYDLQQVRYGHMHPGHAVLIFVTEPLDPVGQVKSDRPDAPGAVPGFKLNLTRSFNTGIYPYSMMSTVLQPLDLQRFPGPLKVTTTSQEWCGHTFTQLNRGADAGAGAIYRVRQFSYFQAEGDTDRTLDSPPGALLEDGILTLIRLDPARLPLQPTALIPAGIYTRLRHEEIRPRMARFTLADVSDATGMNGEPLRRYTITYADIERQVSIDFQRDFPYVIEGWTETYPSLNGEMLTTRARRTHSMMLDYWSRHDPEDRAMRLRLGLPADTN